MQHVRQHVDLRRAKYARAIAVTVLLSLVAGGGLYGWSLRNNPVSQVESHLRGWNFEEAERAAREAVRRDQRSPLAQLRLSRVLLLRDPTDTSAHRHLAAAQTAGNELAEPDRLHLNALLSSISETAPDKCKLLAALEARQRRDRAVSMPTALALGDCWLADRTVVTDAGSPSGFRFESSYQKVDSIYTSLLSRETDNPEAQAAIVPRLVKLLPIQKTSPRLGLLARERKTFVGWPSISGDTVAYIPYPAALGGWTPKNVPSFDRVIAANRARLRSLAMRWSRLDPRNSNAHETLAVILEASGELQAQPVSALKEIELARFQLSNGGITDADNRFLRELRLGNTHVRLLVRVGRFSHAGLLADTLLTLTPPHKLDPEKLDGVMDLLGGLAALRGRPAKLMSFHELLSDKVRVRLKSEEIIALPPLLGADVLRLTTYAIFGIRRDSIAEITQRISDNVAALFPQSRVEDVRAAILIRPLTLAAPGAGPLITRRLPPGDNAFISALQALAGGDRRTAKTHLANLERQRAEFAPGEITIDAVYGESWLKAAVGDTSRAIAQLDNAFRSLGASLPAVLGDPVQAASLVRAMLLRSRLATDRGDSVTALSRASAVQALWGKGDPDVVASLGFARLR
ncbi:MAG: hypothetical protein H0T48_11985 [Gemmatimonadaceae bacterium]|nr:hypothetical protein [Gemmatimonadaceae bacterium]